MNSHHSPNPDHLYDLLVDCAMAGLSESELGELDAMRNTAITSEGVELETLVSMLDLALEDAAAEPLPETLRDKLEQAIDASGEKVVLVGEDVESGFRQPLRRIWMPWISVAALIGLAVSGWWPRLVPEPTLPFLRERAVVLDLPGTSVMTWNGGALGISEEMMEQAEGGPYLEHLLEIGVAGNVAWNAGLQKGHMHFHNLKELDYAGGERYHLWIFTIQADGEPGSPLDGGLFEVHPIQRKSIMAIHPKRRLERPVGYAITREGAGEQEQFDRARVVSTAGEVG